MRILKSVGAVLAGLIFIVFTHSLTDYILESAGILPLPEQGLFDTGFLLLATAYRTFFSIIGGYLTAKLAPSRPMLHALVLGIIGVIGSLAGAVVAMQMNLGPLWYPILLAVTSIPVALLGGWLAVRKTSVQVVIK